jgi:hypothetical protein
MSKEKLNDNLPVAPVISAQPANISEARMRSIPSGTSPAPKRDPQRSSESRTERELRKIDKVCRSAQDSTREVG